MFASFVITFREALEAAIIVSLLLSLLRTVNQQKLAIFVWVGTILGIVMSIVFAFVFELFFGGFEGNAEKIYEGILMLVGFFLISHVILWMGRYNREMPSRIKSKMEAVFIRGGTWALLFLAFVAVVREGIETVIFLEALNAQNDGVISLLGGVVGIIAAIGLVMFISLNTRKVSTKRFFQVSSIFLIFVAAGLLAHGIVELQGAGIIPIIMKPVYDLSNVLSEKEGIGSFLKALFGYDADPSLIALVGYVAYLTGMLYFMMSKSKAQK